MGMTGLSIAWQKAHGLCGVAPIIWQSLAVLSSTLFIALLSIYGLKVYRFPKAVLTEWKHPVRVNFFPTISISLLLLGIVWLETNSLLTFYLWMAGTVIPDFHLRYSQ